MVSLISRHHFIFKSHKSQRKGQEQASPMANEAHAKHSPSPFRVKAELFCFLLWTLEKL